MKIVVTHPNMATITDADQSPVPLEELEHIEASSCISVHLADCMDFVPHKERGALLRLAYSKIRKGGELTLSGTDMDAIVHSMTHCLITIEQLNASLFDGRLSCDYLHLVLDDLRQLGCELDNVKREGLYFSIKVKRPHG